MARHKHGNKGRKKKIISLIIIIIVILAMGFFFHLRKAEAVHGRLIVAMLEDLAGSGWDLKIFEGYATPFLKQWLAKNGTSSVEQLRRMGDMVEFKEIKVFFQFGDRARSVSLVEFDNETALVTIHLNKTKEGKWLLEGFAKRVANQTR